MPSRNPSLHSSTGSACPHRLGLDEVGPDGTTRRASSPLGGPPAPSEILLEMGIAVAAALGLAVVVGLTI